MTHPLQANSTMTQIDFKLLEAELKELRYQFERKVEKRTAQLVKRIAMLESCNATLCDKLGLAQRELTTLKQQSVVQVTRPATETQPIQVKQATPATGWRNPVLSIVERHGVSGLHEERC